MWTFNLTNENSPPRDVMIPKKGDRYDLRQLRESDLATLKIDLAFNGCGDESSCQDMYDRYPFTEKKDSRWEDFKFVLDIESFTSKTTSFRDLLLSGSLVLRASLFEDFWVAQAKPWVCKSLCQC
jgi:hypothetical protein